MPRNSAVTFGEKRTANSGLPRSGPASQRGGHDASFHSLAIPPEFVGPYVLALSERADGGGELEPLAIEAPF
jgi:hypothetical protein